MNKTWGEIRKEALHLGFDREANYVKYKDSFVKAFNWAQNHVAVMSGCIVEQITIVKTASGILEYHDLQDMANRSGREFLHLAQRGVQKAGTSIRVESAKIVDNRFLQIDKNECEDIDVWLVCAPKPINESTPDSYECELPD